jgi:hypothetical protein
MISRLALRRVAKGRLKDAEILLGRHRYDGAVYLCGYAVEIALKARICRTLNWADFPFSAGEFKNLTSLKTHNLDILLHLSGREEAIKNTAGIFKAWNDIVQWDPEFRYRPMGSAKPADAKVMVASTKVLLRQL